LPEPRLTPRVGFVTYAGRPLLTEDDQLTLGPLAALGVTVDPLVWDDTSIRWNDYAALIVRSTWDYHKKASAFLAWLDQVESCRAPLWNPASLLRWNMDKRYLRELASRSVPITPTRWLEAGERADLRSLLEQEGWERAVVKPVLSATAFRTWITSWSEASGQQLEFEDLLSRGGVLVQKFEEAISQGEWSVIFLESAFSHSALKLP
jgi:hypothetical protein